MQKKITLILLIGTVVIGLLFFVFSIVKQDSEDNQNNFVTLEDQIEKWSLYKKNNKVQVGAGKCGNKAFEAILDKLNANERKVYYLNNSLTLVITPNDERWTNNEFIALLNDETSFCAAGGIYPAKAYPDKLLWKGACDTGKIPEGGTDEYVRYQRCIEAEEVLDNFLKQ